jgi:Flp pilus assembly pilin Flp
MKTQEKERDPFSRNQNRQAGATMVEYALVLSLIGIASLTAVQNTGLAIADKFLVAAAAVESGEPPPETMNSTAGDGSGGQEQYYAFVKASRDMYTTPDGETTYSLSLSAE